MRKKPFSKGMFYAKIRRFQTTNILNTQRQNGPLEYSDHMPPNIVRRTLSNLLIVLLFVFFVQFVAKVYAAAYTLSSSTSEARLTYGIILADLDGDGDLDEFAGNGSAAGGHNLYANDGSGVFTHQTTFGTTNHAFSYAAGDIDGDGDNDIAQVYTNMMSYLNIYKNLGGFSFVQSLDVAPGPTTLYNIVLTDVENDGDLDVVMGGQFNNAVYKNDGHGNYTAALSTLPSMSSSLNQSMQAADFTSDGYVDLAFISGGGSDKLMIYRNSGTGAFTELFSVAASLQYAPAVGDFDGDGDIDVVVTNTSNQVVTYKNNGAGTSFTAGTPVASGFTNVQAISTGDIDNDGDLDLVIGSGQGAQGAKVLANDGTGVFSALGSPTETSDTTYGIAIGDIDSDGDLDYARGNAAPPTGEVNRRYKNDQAATSANTAPTAPSGLTATVITSGGGIATVRLSWGSGSDTETTTRLLQYQLKVGTGSNTNNIISGKTASPLWVTRLMPNGQSRTMLLKNIPCNTTFYWNAATVDTGYKSTWGTEQSFTLDNTCTITTGGGGSSTPSVGGGLPAWFFHQRWNTGRQEGGSGVSPGTITVSAFTDLIENGRKDPQELRGFAGLPITASGRTMEGVGLRRTQQLNESGESTFSLPPSDPRGYWILVDTGSEVLKGFDPTTETLTGGLVLSSNDERAVAFGFTRSDLIRYEPCLEIGDGKGESPSDTEAGKLLMRLQNSFGHPVLGDISFSDTLMKRRNFLQALSTTQCIAVPRNLVEILPSVRERVAGRFALPLIDLPVTVQTQDSLLVYSLLDLGISVQRPTLKGFAADLSSPVTRGEAIQMIFDALDVPAEHIVTSGPLPIDLEENDALVPAYLTLKHLGILPGSFAPILGQFQGVDPAEASVMLARAAFRGGRIHLLDPVFDRATKKKLLEATKIPTFLAEIPSIEISSCLENTMKRSADFSYSDVLPGNSLATDITNLLRHGTRNSDDRMMWLLSGTTRPTEFGVNKGSSTLNLEEPPSIVEVIRTLLVLSCLPPDTPIDAKNKEFDGSGKSKIAREAISNLPRDSSFASRVLYKAQDHQRAYDLSLFTFAPELLRQEKRAPGSVMSVGEATSLMASTLLRMIVLQERLTPQAATGEAEALRFAIAKDLLGTDVDWRDASLLATTPFTRHMLIRFLATVVNRRTFITPFASGPSASLGSIWWERVK